MKNNEAFIIEYKINFIGLKKPENHTTKVKNCMGELHAKIKLEDWLKKKHFDFQKLEVIKCEKDILSIFEDLFGKNNPFSDIFNNGFK